MFKINRTANNLPMNKSTIMVKWNIVKVGVATRYDCTFMMRVGQGSSNVFMKILFAQNYRCLLGNRLYLSSFVNESQDRENIFSRNILS